MLSVIMLSVIKQSVIMLSVIVLSVIMLSVIMLSVIMLSVIMLSVIMLNVIILDVAFYFILSVVILNVDLLSVVMPSVVMPLGKTLLLLKRKELHVTAISGRFCRVCKQALTKYLRQFEAPSLQKNQGLSMKVKRERCFEKKRKTSSFKNQGPVFKKLYFLRSFRNRPIS
jgi:hypothetical protein